jgi:hypothetical protein
MNDGGDLPGELLEAVFDAAQVVKLRDRNVIEDGLDDAKPAGNGVRRVDVAGVFELRLDTDQRGVVQSR